MFQFQLPLSRFPPPWRSFPTTENRSVAGPMFRRTKLGKLSEVRREWEKFLSLLTEIEMQKATKRKGFERGTSVVTRDSVNPFLNCPFLLWYSRVNSIKPLWPGLWSTSRIFVFFFSNFASSFVINVAQSTCYVSLQRRSHPLKVPLPSIVSIFENEIKIKI